MARAKRSKQVSRRRGRARRSVATRPGSREPASERQACAGICLGLLLLGAAIYFPVVHHDFVTLDDPTYFLGNPYLDGRLGLDDLRRAFAEPYFANWIPLTSISIAIDNALWGPDPAGTLLLNVALHLAAGLVLLLALRRMSGAWGPSAFVAALFVAHPLHVESVAWASQRKDVLMGLLWMASLYAYARYAERPDARRYAWVAAGVACALLAKPTAVTLPFALLLLDLWPLRRIPWEAGRAQRLASIRRLVLEKIPLVAMSAAAGTATLLAQRSYGAEHTTDVSLPLRIANALYSLLAYLTDSVWPSGLAISYPYGEVVRRPGSVRGAALLLLLATGASLGLARRRPYLLVGWLWFLGTLAPTLGLIQVGVQARADRYMYIPLIGLSVALAWGISESLPNARPVRRATLALACAAVLALGAVAHHQVRYWHDSLALFRHAVSVTENNFVAHDGLGNAYRKAGDLERAEHHLREALRISPQLASTRISLGLVLAETGRFSEARAELRRAPDARASAAADAQAALGIVAQREGDPREAAEHYRAALKSDATQREAGNNLAWLLATSEDSALRDPEEAVRLAEGLSAHFPDDPEILDTLAAAYAAQGRSAEAARTQARALAALPEGDSAMHAAFRARLAAYRAADTDPTPR